MVKANYDRLDEMISCYANGERSLSDVAKEFSVPMVSMYRKFKGLGVDTKIDYKRNGQRVRQFSIDENYFNKINTRAKAYIFGWLMSDGCMYYFGRGKQIRLKIADIDMLESIKIEMNYDRDLFVNKKASERHKQTKTLIISSVTMFDDLVNLGCTPRKSLTKKFPLHSVSLQFMKDFIRGYFDGNGSAHLYKQGKHTFIEVKICSSVYFSKGLSDIFKSIGINCQLSNDKRSSEFCGDVRIRSLKDTRNFFEYIYDDLDNQLFLKRKRDKYLIFKKDRNY